MPDNLNNPPFIETQVFRLLQETDRPERFLRPEYFRAGRGMGPALADRDLGTWITVDREDVLHNRVTQDDGTACDLSRMVLTTDAGVGKTIEMQWLEAMLNQPGGQTAAFFLTFSQLPSRVDELFDEVLLPRLLRANGERSQDFSKADALHVVKRLRSEGRLVLLMDALDQAPADGSAAAMLKTILKDSAWRECRIVVSGRPHALQRHWASLFDVDLGIGWRFLQVDEFDEQQQRQFLGGDASGSDRYDIIPAEAREILATPRVLEYLRRLSDSELKRIQTAGDVYWQSIGHLLAEGMRGSESARKIGLAAQEQTPTTVQARSVRRARQLLGAVAFEMTSTCVVRRDPESGQEQQVPNFDGVRRGDFERFRQSLLLRLSTPHADSSSQLLDRDLDGLAALNDFVAQGIFDTSVPGLQEVFWRNRTLQEFFTAFWLSQYCSEEDSGSLRHWLYLSQLPLTEEYYWVWRFLAEMHDDAVDRKSWARAIEPLFRPGDGTGAGTKRSTEIIYRAWPRLQQLADDGAPAARDVLTRFLGEFQDDILSGKRGEDVQQIAQQFCANFVELPEGEFHMGAPADKQGIPDDVRKWWQDYLDEEGDPVERSESLVDDWYSFTPGKRGQEERCGAIASWTQILRDRDLEAVIEWLYPFDETPEEPIQALTGFSLSRWPTINAWYRLFSPDHGMTASYYREKYAEISPTSDAPVIFVSWYDAWAFCQWAHWDGLGCRLPREYEWEYAAKAETDWQWNHWWGDEFEYDKCNGDNRVGRTTPPTDEHANPWGLIDMLGNVWEWTADEYRTKYDRDGRPDRSARVLRGGSWVNDGDYCRSAIRYDWRPASSLNGGGFRVARARKS